MQNQSFEGFQQGNAENREYGVVVDLYSDDGSVELIFTEKNYNCLRRGYAAGNQSYHPLFAQNPLEGRVVGYFTNFANLLGSMAMNTARPRASTSSF